MELSRWHAASCQIPDVFLELNIIRCRAGDLQCDWEEFLAISRAGNAQASALIGIPPDEPISNRNLFWPPSVPYSKASPESSSEHASEESDHAQVALDLEIDIESKSTLNPELRSSIAKSESPRSLPLAQPSPAAERRSIFSPVEREAIAPDEFRLVCLSTVSDPSYPVHLSLETYSHDNCPEYETVSYTWGGENGDNSLSRPIYIGPFWDILLQTENCWEMLRFIRPSRGIRMVWVDALCINQNNIKERGEQVANMGNIYRDCSRTIVYLGVDIILPTHDRFPRRQRLHELQKSAVGPQLPETSHTVPSSDLLKAILKRRYFSRVWVIQELILSQRAVLRIGDVDFLTDRSVWEGLTSDWQWDSTAAPWLQYMAHQKVPVQNVFELMRLTSRSQCVDARDRLFGVLNLMETSTQASRLTPDYSLSKRHVYIGFFAHCLVSLKMLHLFHSATGLRNPLSPSWVPDWESQRSWENLFSVQVRTDDIQLDLTPKMLESHHNNYIFVNRPWHKDISIDRNTGATSLFLTHFGVLPSPPQITEIVGSKYRFRVTGQRSSLFLTTHIRLDDLKIQPRQDHLFILDHGDGNLTFFILREVDLPDSERQYKIVANCSSVYVAQFSGFPRLQILQTSVFDTIDQIHQFLNDDLSTWSDSTWSDNSLNLAQFFPGFHRRWDILPVLRAWHLYGDNNHYAFDDYYIGFIKSQKPQLKPTHRKGYIQFSFKPEEWKNFYIGFATRNTTQWLDGENWVSISKFPLLKRASLFLQNSHNMEVRVELKTLQDTFWSYRSFSIFNLNLKRLQKVMKMDFDEAISLCRQGKEEKLRYIGCPPGFENLEDFQIDGSTFKVKIL